MKTIDHLSPSTVQSYRTCGYQVYYNKILDIKNPVTYAMTEYGSAMHEAIEKLTKENLSRDAFIKEFADRWTSKIGEVNTWKTDTPEHLLKEGCIACGDFFDNIYPKYNVVLVEERFVIEEEGKLPILCFTDAVTKEEELIDYKFGRGLTGMASANNYICNVAAYAWAYQKKTGKMPKKITFIKEKWKKRKDKETGKFIFYHDCFVEETVKVTQKDIDFYKGLFNMVEAAIKAGIFFPAPDESFLCKSCGYRQAGICAKPDLTPSEEE